VRGDDQGGGNLVSTVLSSSVGVCDRDGEWSPPPPPTTYTTDITTAAPITVEKQKTTVCDETISFLI
jgi:hypothetical protein